MRSSFVRPLQVIAAGLCVLYLIASHPASAFSFSNAAGSELHMAASMPLDDIPNALAAYSLRQVSSSYNGSAIRVRRSTDGQERDFGFVNGDLDVAGIEGWLGNAHGEVLRWYSQLPGHPAMAPYGSLKGPLIAEGGRVFRDSEGNPRLSFFGVDGLQVSGSGLPGAVAVTNSTVSIVFESDPSTPGGTRGGMFQFGPDWEGTSYTLNARSHIDYWLSGAGSGFGDATRYAVSTAKTAMTIALSSNQVRIFDRHEKIVSTSVTPKADSERIFSIGAPGRLKDGDGNWTGYVSEVIIQSGASADQDVLELYDNVNSYWKVGPAGYNTATLLPQQYEYQITLLNWLKTVDVSDVTLPRLSVQWDGSLSDVDKMADLWLQAQGVSASRVVRGEPEWYVLDAGNGKGIEATGSIRIWHGTGSSNSRSWSNEPAFLYQLSVPRSNGGQGNPYYKHPALAYRALVIAAVDMMMYDREASYGGSHAWNDMYGKAMLGWTEAYRWTREILPPNVQAAFEAGFARFLDRTIAQGARNANTNMDMFIVHAAADLYMVSKNPDVREKAVQATKRILFGYPDGELGSRHSVAEGYGVFHPAGYIGENDTPEVFYNGESLYHLTGAYVEVRDEPEWEFLEDVVRRITEWKMYMHFYDPGRSNDSKSVFTSPSGFSGRTSGSTIGDQASEIWRELALADLFEVGRPLVTRPRGGGVRFGSFELPDPASMQRDITKDLSDLTKELSTVHSGQPPEWSGWSPWVKATPYLPPAGWYSRLKSLVDSRDDDIYLPIERPGYHYNRAFGGPPTGYEFWSYKNTDGRRDWGFYVEADAQQGTYGGWFGGKVETFWTETTGIVLLNRHGKTGCEVADSEDSTCWDNLEYKAAHHVWGRDEKGRGFTTLLQRGRDLQRTSTFQLELPEPNVTVVNYFNDPSVSNAGHSGEETGGELTGAFSITNSFTAKRDGLQVVHTVDGNQTDQLSELWASLPVLLKQQSSTPGDNMQSGLPDATIEYLSGSQWRPLPGDTSGDGIPEMVSTTALRIGRDYKGGAGPQYAYVHFEDVERVRLSTRIYEDPYQTKTRVRTVHIDMHGSPGTSKTVSSETSLTYFLSTTDPLDDVVVPPASQVIRLDAGWNYVSSYVQPQNALLSNILADVANVVLEVRDGRDRVYKPSEGLTSLDRWDAVTAYSVYATEPTTITISGNHVDVSSSSLALQEGWNLLPYPLATSLPIGEALGTIMDRVVMVKDHKGRAYQGEFGISTIVNLEPGHAYKIQLSRATTISFITP